MRERGARAERPGLALLVIVIGVLMTAVDTTIVVLALPEMQRDLHVGLSGITWVVIGYLLVITLLATQVGRLGDMFGRVRMYQAGFAIFILGSGLCALAQNESMIIGFRILQGVGGALISANSGAVIADNFPPQRRGRAYGFNSVGWSLGAVLGVLIGGLLVTYVSWRWIFWINLPAGCLALLVAFRVLRERGRGRAERLDWPGMVALGAAIFGILWAMTRLATAPFTPEVIGYLVGGLVMLGAFVLLEAFRPDPMIRLDIFRIPTMTPALLAATFQSLANFAVLFLVIMYLQGVRQLTPIQASLLLVPGYLVGSVVGPLAGRLADRIGAFIPATAGLVVQVVALAAYARLQVTTPLWLVTLASVVNGVGSGAFFPANNSAVMRVARGPEFGVASGMLRTFANIGMVFSFSLAILVAAHAVSRQLAFAIFVGSTTIPASLAATFTNGLHAAFYSSMAVMSLAAVLSSLRGRRSAPA